MDCRFCATPLVDVFLDLGTSPPSNAYLAPEALQSPETWFPLKLFTCRQCHLVQVDEVQGRAELFASDYAYHSSYSRSWLEHARRYVDKVVPRLGLGPDSLAVELASNDGYLLQYMAERSVPCLGIEPTAGTAAVAQSKGIDTLVRFFGRQLADELVTTHGHADLIVANNVLAHVPDINDFVSGIGRLLSPGGTVTVEFPHLLELVEKHQFDTVYHEHFSYLSLRTVQAIFAAHGLRIWDVEELQTHGGSLRVWSSHAGATYAKTSNVERVLQRERDAGMSTMEWYEGFQKVAEQAKNAFIAFLLEQKRAGKTLAAYGAAAKGNTLLNFAGIRSDLIAFVADASPYKQGRFLPGSRIPVVNEQHLRDARPDFVVVLPWNLKQEITEQLSYVREWGGQFVFAIPQLATE
jgi:SAM-dependent methyltransferase